MSIGAGGRTETNFWRLLRDNLRKDFYFDRVETVTGVGVPDVFWTAKDGTASGWMELKVVRGRKIRFGKEQIHWIETRAAAGVRCLIAARYYPTCLS